MREEDEAGRVAREAEFAALMDMERSPEGLRSYGEKQM